MLEDFRGVPRAVWAVLITVPIVLTLLEYYGMPWHYRRHVEVRTRVERGLTVDAPRNPPLVEALGGVDLPPPPWMEPHHWKRVQPFAWWSGMTLLLLVVIPLGVGRVLGGMSPRQLGLRLKGTGREAWTYLAIFLVFLPVVIWVSHNPSFQRTYPFFRPRTGESLTDAFLTFEVLYFLQFFAIEFFFRGFLVLGLKPHIGRASIAVMLAPYCMIHYYKPLPEAMGAIGAGLVLGSLSYRSGTVLYGWWLHFGVALSMDLLALHHGGLL